MRSVARRRQRGSRRVSRVGLLAAAVLTIAGLLAMHALSLHGTATDGEHGMLSLPAAHVDHRHSLDHADHESAGHESGAHLAPADHDSHGGHGAKLLCAAFLLAVGTLLLAGLRRRAPAWWRTTSVRWSRSFARPPCLTHEAAGPPAVWAFSVIRC